MKTPENYTEAILHQIREPRGMSIRNRILAALEQERFRFALEKIIARDNTVIGKEALLRIDGKGLGAAAEEGGACESGEQSLFLDITVTARVLLLNENRPVHINVFLSTFCRQEFMSTVESFVRIRKVDPSRFVFEILEYERIRDYPRVLENIGILHRMGFAFALDDFVGSSEDARRIDSIPAVSIVKYDRFWTSTFGDADKLAYLVRSVDSMRQMGKMVIAEGIEEESQLLVARSVGFDAFQGYLFNPEMDPKNNIS